MSLGVMSLGRLRDRAFGVEIEFGMDENGGESHCDCWCYCEDLEVDNEECDVCRYGCQGYSDECGGHYGSDFSAVERVLGPAGYGEWLEDIHEDGSGIEISSPILRGKKGLFELYEVMRLLREAGAFVTDSDGLHIHHDAPEFVNDDELTWRLVDSWTQNQAVIDHFVARYRRSGADYDGDGGSGRGYWACPPIGMDVVDRYKAQKLSPKNLFRYALNVGALNEHGSVEFRQHQGTLDFNEAAAWLRFGQAFLDSVKRRTCPLPSLGQPEDLLRRIRVTGQARAILLEKAAA